MNVPELIHAREGKTLEFKRDLSSLQPILKTLVAFANTSGGTLVIGIQDDGVVVGIADPLREEERLASSIADSIRPAMTPEIAGIARRQDVADRARAALARAVLPAVRGA
jgi:predicted HTH transcriptional regulator